MFRIHKIGRKPKKKVKIMVHNKIMARSRPRKVAYIAAAYPGFCSTKLGQDEEGHYDNKESQSNVPAPDLDQTHDIGGKLSVKPVDLE